MKRRSLPILLIVLFFGVSCGYSLASNNTYRIQEDTIYNFDKVTLPYVRFHKSQSWREGAADYGCFDSDNPYFCPDSNDIGGIRSYLKPIGQDSFELEMNIYSPKNNNNSLRPTILFIHGSGLLPNNSINKNDESVNELAEMYTDKGYNFVAIDYRKGWEAHYVNLPAQFLSRLFCYFYACSLDGGSDDAMEQSYTMAMFKATQDLLAAHRFIHFNAEEFNIDTDNIFYYGISTGGIVSLTACFADNSNWNQKLKPYYGPLDVNAFGKYQDLKNEISTSGIISLSAGIPELDWITEDEAISTPLFMIHGTRDYISPYIKGNVLSIAGYKDSPTRGEVFNLYGSKAIYDHIRKLNGDYAQIQLNSLYNMEHGISNDMNLLCPLFLSDELFKFMSSIRNTGYINNSKHTRYTNFVDSTLICTNRNNKINYGKPYFKGDRFMYMFNGADEEFINGFEWGEGDFTIDASITPIFRRNNKSNILSTKLPDFIEKKGYDFGITKDRKLFLYVSDESGSRTFEGTTILENEVCSHIAVTRKDSTIIFYVNGEPTDSFVNVKNKLLNPYLIWIGNGISRPNAGFSGYIEYIRGWKSGFNKEKINLMKDDGTGLVFPNGSITGFFDFTENEEQLFTEYVNGYQATSGLFPFGGLGDPFWTALSDYECMNEDGRLSNFEKENLKGFDVVTDQEISLYPNPFKSSINIKGLQGDLGTYQVMVTSINGQLIWQRFNFNSENELNIDLSSLEKGFYLITIKNGDTLVATKKVIKL